MGGGRGQRMRWCGWREGSEDEVVWVEGGVQTYSLSRCFSVGN